MDKSLFPYEDGQEIRPVSQTTRLPLVHELLRRALAEEFIAWYQYYIVKDVLYGREGSVAESILGILADDELNDHAEKLKQRLIEIGDDLTFINDPAKWNELTPNKLVKTDDLSILNILHINIAAEENAIQTYNALISAARAAGDETTIHVGQQILADEQKHLRDLKDILANITA